MQDMTDMNHKSETGYRVSLSHEGLRRAYNDNGLLRSTKATNVVVVWAATIAMGIFMGWMAAEGLAR